MARPLKKLVDAPTADTLPAPADDAPEVEPSAALEEAAVVVSSLASPLAGMAAPAVSSSAARPPCYVIPKASRYVTGGAVHHIAAGSVVSENTHDLSAMRAQGIIMEAKWH